MRANSLKLSSLLLPLILAFTFPGPASESGRARAGEPSDRPHGASAAPAILQGAGDFKLVPGENNNFCRTIVTSDGKTALQVVVSRTNFANSKAKYYGAYPTVSVTFSPGGTFTLSGKTCKGTNPCYYKPLVIPGQCFGSDCPFTITLDPTNKFPDSDKSNNTAQGICVG
jgi:hypothetical protein